MDASGRLWPVRCRYRSAAIAAAPERSAETLYASAGCMEISGAAGDRGDGPRRIGPVRLCFNGDFNCLNVDDAGFRAINERVLRHDAIVGTVEG